MSRRKDKKEEPFFLEASPRRGAEGMRVIIAREVWDKVMAVTRTWNREVGGILEVSLEGRTLRVTDVVGVKQTTGPGDVSFDEFTFRDYLEGKGWWGVEMPTAVWGIWHSHVNMGVFASMTDEEMIRRFVSRGYLVNLIVNKKGEGLVRVDSMAGGDRESEAFPVTIPSTWEVEVEEKWGDWAQEYVKAFVTEKVVVVRPREVGVPFSFPPSGGYYGDGAGEGGFFTGYWEPTKRWEPGVPGEEKGVQPRGKVERILDTASEIGWDRDTVISIARGHCGLSKDASDDEAILAWWKAFSGDEDPPGGE